MKKAICKTCGKEFNYNSSDRPNPSFCNRQCYLANPKLTKPHSVFKIGHPFGKRFKKGHKDGMTGKHHSEETKEHIRDITSGNKNHNWQGGSRKWSLKTARKTLEQAYNIKWADMYKPNDCVIHHINGNWRDNQFDNLCVLTRGDHLRVHRLQGDLK